MPRLRGADLGPEKVDATLSAVKNVLGLIRHKRNDLFESSQRHDGGLDQETQLPDRRYLPAIHAHAMRAHIESGRPFCHLLAEAYSPTLKCNQATGTRSRLLQVAMPAASAWLKCSSRRA